MAGVGSGSTGATHRATEPLAMESWLLDVKRVRIPRPKFQAGALRYPTEPPKDYYVSEESEKAKRSLEKATEELRRGIQEKL
ncbi:uncharacterized protein LOC124364675 [Homalodisca vitripennis]|uniref:uncharacterized protein LOC124364675 n=1 Tax=Homalodisca vitripennis TaxID=197043 RepID=UPI001EEA3329|nr:uncharacterized protein LOC124364675 [Homalodisca vitripennis]